MIAAPARIPSAFGLTLRDALWLVWLAIAAAFTAQFFLWEVRYFHSPGSQFYNLLLVLLPLFFAALPVWLWIRRRGLWRWEPMAVTGLLLAAFLFYHLVAALVAIIVIVAAYALGRWISERLKLEAGPPSADIPFSAAIGFAALGPVLFIQGLLHLYFAWAFALVLAAICIVCRREIRKLLSAVHSLASSWSTSPELRDPMAGLAVIFGAIAAGAAAVVIIVPSIAFDPIHTHLISVRYYAATHALAPVPRLNYSYFPQATEALMTLGWSLAGQPGAQMMTAIFFLLIALLALRLAREAGASRVAAVAGAAMALTVPVLHWTGSVAKNDVMMTFFQLAALECFLAWRRSGNFRWIGCGAVLLATAFDVKHVAIFGAVPIALLFIYAVWKQPHRLRAALSIAALFVVFGLYWHARTFLLTGNPLFPESFNRGSSTMSRSRGEKWPSVFRNPVGRYAKIAWVLHSRGQTLFESPLPTPVGILLVVCWPAWFLIRGRKWNAAEKAMLLFAGVYLIYWGGTFPIVRYALGPIVILYTLTGARLAEFAQASSPPIRFSAQAAAAWCFTVALLGIAIIEINAPQLRLLAGRIDDAEYLREALLTSDVNSFLGRSASPGDHVVFVDIGADLYSPRSIDIQSFFLARGKLPPELPGVLRSSDYQWLVVLRRRVPAIIPMAESAKNVTLIWQDPNYEVFRVSRKS